MGTQKNTIRRGGCIKESIKMRFLTIFSLAVVICVAICADSSKTEKKELKERDESEKKAPLENVMYADDDKAEDNEKMEEDEDNGALADPYYRRRYYGRRRRTRY